MKSIKASSICCFAVCALLLSACDVTTPSQVHTGEIQVKDVMKTATVDPAHVSSESVEIISKDYAMNGTGPMRLVVPYQPRSPLEKIAAEAEGARYQKAFAAKGVKDFRVSYTATVEPKAMAVISYMALAAEPPRNCHHISAYYGAAAMKDTEGGQDIGCEIKSAQAQMIARPADLLGTAGVPQDDSRRQGTVVERYKAGTPNPALTGLSASGQ
jgi:type IV pilus biogenesis protein CpaD/CtpE